MSSSSFWLKLAALGHPNPQSFNCEDEKEYRSVVLWLEDQKIRHYKIEEREGLRNINSNDWNIAYDAYQKDLMSPASDFDIYEQLTWLLSYAVRLEYADNAQKYNNAARQEEIQQIIPNIVSCNPLDNLDFTCAGFRAGVGRISALGSIAPHPDPRYQIAALAHVLRTSPHLDINHNECQGPVFTSAYDVYKLLFIQDLRILQTQINEALVAVQSVTADPRTDTRLGRVGR